MKTILVLTDFSANADYAGHYALKLAQNMEANLLLCNVYDLPYDEKTADDEVWPLPIREKNSIEDLGGLAARLKTEIEEVKGGLFRPEIDQCSYEGSLIDRINEIAAEKKILMAVMSSHDAEAFSMPSVDHTHDLIEKADFPVLIIPYQVHFKKFHTMVFATMINNADKNIVESLAGFAKYFNSTIQITHIADSGSDEKKGEIQLSRFFSGTAYPKINYRSIASGSVVAGLKRITAYSDIDLLVLVHRKRNLFQKIFKGSIALQLADHSGKPLLVFPGVEVRETVPVTY